MEVAAECTKTASPDCAASGQSGRLEKELGTQLDLTCACESHQNAGSLLELTLAWLIFHVLLLQDRAPVCLSLDPLCPVQG